MMRILHVSDAFLPKQGGIEVQVRDLAERQRAAGHDVAVLTCTPPVGARALWAWTTGPWGRSPAQAPRPADPDDPTSLPTYRTGVPWPHIPQSNAALHALLREHRPDVVHAHLSVLSPLGILAVRDAARQGVPVVMTLHSLWWWAASLYLIADRLIRWGSWAVQWTAVSDLAAEPLRRIVGTRAEVTVLPNGVDPTTWATVPVPRDENDVVLVSVMRLALRKRPRALLRAVRDVRRRLPDGVRVRLVLVGDGPQRLAVQRLVRRYGLTNGVDLTGRRDHEGIRELYRRADVYVAPATLESFGIAALEARCAGLPVVARQRTGIADFVHHEVHGLLADSDPGLADAILRLATDPPLRDRIAHHNHACAPQTGWADVLHRCDLAYKSATELSGGRPSATLPEGADAVGTHRRR